MKAVFGGAAAGTNVFESVAPNKLTSATDFTIAGHKMAGTLTLTTEKGVLAGFNLKQKLATTEVDCALTGNKLTLVVAGKTTTTTLKEVPKACMASFHPQTLRTLIAAYDTVKGGKQSIPTVMMDGGSVQSIEVVANGTTPFKQGGRTVVLHPYQMTASNGIANIAFDVLQDDAGAIVGMNVPIQSFQVVEIGFEGVFVDPTSKYKELSQPVGSSRVLSGVKIPMRDGVVTVADIALPDPPLRAPAILVRTPYGRHDQFAGAKAEWWAERGYAFVVQDCRGRHDSGGEWDPFMHERKDGYDTVQWIAKQPWCDGNVGMIGGSYSGEVQWAAAVEVPLALKCIIPEVSPPDAMFNIPFDYGTVPIYTDLWWADLVKERVTNMGLAAKPFAHSDKLTTLPLVKLPEAVIGQKIPFFDNWLKRDTARSWAASNYEDDLAKVKIPALMISGWWDGDGIGTKRNWQIMAGLGRTNQWLIDGPWPHGFNSSTSFGGVDYGATSVLELDSVYLRWFDTWLKHKEVGLENVPKVRVFLTGANEWRDLRGWPDPRSKETKLYLSVPTPGRGEKPHGELLAEPAAGEPPSQYKYDPNNSKAPKGMGAANVGAASTVVQFDAGDNDRLTFKTAILNAPVDMGGPIAIDLWLSSTAHDADFFAMVVDIDPAGVARLVGMPGKIRVSYLSGWNSPHPIVPGKIYKATLEHWDTAHRFLPGHRIGLIISSNMFPGYARNPGTGEPVATATHMISARETIYHDEKHPSCLRFMVLPNDGR